MTATNAMVFYSYLLTSAKERIEQNGGVWQDYFNKNQDYLLVSIPQILYPVIIEELKFLDRVKDVTEEIKSDNIKTKILVNFDLEMFRNHLTSAPIIYS